jgi:NitT/TauT family transport system substrate-binding protein
MFFNKSNIQMQAVRYGHMASDGSGHFFVLASGKSNIASANDLKGVEIGISKGTIIDYITTRLLEGQGFSADEIKTISVPKIPDRMSLLASGELKAAVMPDPLASLAIQQGAKIILDDISNPKIGASVISFRKEVIDAHPEAIKSFLAAIEDAVTLINDNPGKFSGLLAEKKIIPQPLIGKYVIPKFPTEGVPSETEWNDVLAWAKTNNLLNVNVSYKDSVNSAFLP